MQKQKCYIPTIAKYIKCAIKTKTLVIGVLSLKVFVYTNLPTKQTRCVRSFAAYALVLNGSSKGMALTRAHRACQEVIKYAWVSKCPVHPMFANGQGFGQ